MRYALAAAVLCLPFGLAGCSPNFTSPAIAVTGAALQGRVMGGQQPIVGSHVYLYAANTTGYGNASISLLNAVSTGHSDGNGAYVLSDGNGDFSISSDYTCSTGQQVYTYALGGNPGSGTNSAAGLLAVLGKCPGPSFSSSTSIQVNEVSTIAAAYALSGFVVDPTHVSSSGTTLSQTGIANAFANAANIVSLSTGAALTTTPSGTGAVPQSTVNTLADILASCVNSTGPSSPACTTLLGTALAAGTSGTAPTNTATAAINIAHYPGANVSTIYGIPIPTAPFIPTLSTQPNDLTLAINFTDASIINPANLAIDASGDVWVADYNLNTGNSVTEMSSSGVILSGISGYSGGCLQSPNGIAIDALGDAWVANSKGNCVTEISPTGVFVSGTTGYTGGSLNGPGYLAIDGVGNVWVSNYTGNSVTEFSSAGLVLSGTNGYASGKVSTPYGVAVDGSNHVWIANTVGATTKSAGISVTVLSSTGSVLSGSSGYTGGGLNVPTFIAFDSSGDAWITNYGTATTGTNTSITEMSYSGSILSGSNGYTGGGISKPQSVSIDGAGNAWIANFYSSTFNTVTELSSSGAILSPSTGFSGSGTISTPQAVAVDGSGNVWVANLYTTPPNTGSITELVGAGTPVITPIVAGLPLTPTAHGTSSLGTRP